MLQGVHLLMELGPAYLHRNSNQSRCCFLRSCFSRWSLSTRAIESSPAWRKNRCSSSLSSTSLRHFHSPPSFFRFLSFARFRLCNQEVSKAVANVWVLLADSSEWDRTWGSFHHDGSGLRARPWQWRSEGGTRRIWDLGSQYLGNRQTRHSR